MPAARSCGQLCGTDGHRWLRDVEVDAMIYISFHENVPLDTRDRIKRCSDYNLKEVPLSAYEDFDRMKRIRREKLFVIWSEHDQFSEIEEHIYNLFDDAIYVFFKRESSDKYRDKVRDKISLAFNAITVDRIANDDVEGVIFPRRLDSQKNKDIAKACFGDGCDD